MNTERETLWQARVEQWRASGLSQRAFARQHGYRAQQMGYWVQRLSQEQAPAMVPATVRRDAATSGAISLRGERGWSLTLPHDVPAAWLAELLRAL